MKISTIPATLVALSLMSGTTLADEAPAPTAPPQPPPQTTAPATTAPTETAPEKSQTQNEDDQEDDQKVVCKKIDPPAGSRIGGKRACHTVAEWRLIRETSRDAVQKLQSPGVTSQAGGS